MTRPCSRAVTGTPSITADVLVIGGGPAGAVLAARLAALGFDVVLAEKSRFPRRQIGESSPAALLPVLEHLGVLDEMKERHALAPAGALIRWGRDGLHHQTERAGDGWVLDRALFDQILLDAARRSGVHVLQPATVAAVSSPDGGTGRVRLISGGVPLEIQVRFVGIATGRSGGLGGRRRRCAPATLALYGYWKTSASWPARTIVEAGDHGWYWAARLPDGSVNAAAFCDPRDSLVQESGDPEAAYRVLLSRSRDLSSLLGGALVSHVHVTDASPQLVSPVCGVGFLRVGDAAVSLDPLSAQGTVKAMTAALQGVAIINTFLNRPGQAAAAADFARARQREAIDHDRQLGAQHYRDQASICPTAFWAARAGAPQQPAAGTVRPGEPPPHVPLRLCGDARITSTPVVEGDFVAARTALAHPALDRPLAFARNVPFARLLPPLLRGWNAKAVIADWSRAIGEQQAAALLAKLWRRGVISDCVSGADQPAGALLVQQGRELHLD